jgi:prepilin signal peptidase PulO-like enzyme (type II secretory pathway)
MGATVGSFLNVVVYRLPLGKNLAYPGSFCPKCGHPIRLQDNIPILSWLALGGRCRDCKGKISPRYFFVELTVAALFLLVLAAELYLPPGALGFATRRLLTPHDGPAFWCMYFIHVSLITTFLTFLLIVADGNAAGSRLFFPVTLVAFVLPLLWPQIRSVPAAIYPDAIAWWTGLVDGLAGLTAALIFWEGRGVIRSRQGDERPGIEQFGWAAAIGIVLGWQRSIYALPVTACLLVLAVRSVRRLGRTTSTDETPLVPGAECTGDLSTASNGDISSVAPDVSMPAEETSPVPSSQEIDTL